MDLKLPDQVAHSEGGRSKLALRMKDRAAGFAEAPTKPKREPAEFYKVTGVEFLLRAEPKVWPTAPFRHLAPDVEVYRERGMRRLDPRRYAGPCRTCTWRCRMAVGVIVDPWNPSGARRYRTETFCYGPKSFPLYLPGPSRKVPGRNGMSYEEEDWVDAEETSGRGDDE